MGKIISTITCRAATPARWKDVELLFGPRGACAGCWCMAWRLKRSVWENQKGIKNKRALKAIIESGLKPGLLAYDGQMPVGWCAVAPREAFPALTTSRVLKPIDDQPVWSVVCFYIARAYRHRGLSIQLLRAAVDHVKKSGGTLVEGYPVDTKNHYPDTFAWTGLASAFRQAGFQEVTRRSATRPIMRYRIPT